MTYTEQQVKDGYQAQGRAIQLEVTMRQRRWVYQLEKNLRIEQEQIVNFSDILRKRTYADEIRRLVNQALKQNLHADLLEVMMMFKRIKM